MWSKRKRNRCWLAGVLPCRTLRHRDSTLFKLTVVVCLAFPAYIMLFNSVSGSLGLPGDDDSDGDFHPDSGRSKGPASARAGRAPGGLGHQPRNARGGSLVRDGSAGPLMTRDAVSGPRSGTTGSHDAAFQRGDSGLGQITNSTKQKVQFISGTKVLYLGCYHDETERTLRALREGFIADVHRMTVPMCIRHCFKRGSYYAGLEFHSECYCGKRIYHSAPVDQHLCNSTCAGNSSETCGGAPYLSMYQLVSDEERPDQSQKSASSAEDSGVTDDFRACVPRPPVPANQPVFPHGYFTTAERLTVDSCITTCYQRLFPVAALGRRIECHCGFFSKTFRMETVLPTTECNVPCRGDENFFCGGVDALSIYQTAAEDHRCTNTTLRPPGSLPTVALASFPGSGNTWVRYLIERATGVYTGSFYNDGDLFKKGFLGEKEKWTSGRTVVVKTHRFDEEHVRSFERAIAIIRNPYKAIISEHNRKFGGHVGYAPETQYTKGTEWISFVTGKSRTWANTAVNFIQYSKRIHVVYFEDMQTKLYDTMRGVLNFLDFPVDEERLLCVLSSPHGKFKRSVKRKNPLNFDPYTEEMREMVDLSLKTVSMALKLRNCTGLPRGYDPMLQL